MGALTLKIQLCPLVHTPLHLCSRNTDYFKRSNSYTLWSLHLGRCLCLELFTTGTAGQSPSQPLGLNMNITPHTHTHTHVRVRDLHDHSVREYSSFMALITTRTWRFTSPPARVGSESLLGFSRTPPQCWEAECTVLKHESMDTSPLRALRPHEMGRPGGNTGKYKNRAGWPLPHFLSSFSPTMGGGPDLAVALCAGWVPEEVGSRRPCPQTQMSQELGFCLLKHDGSRYLSQYEFLEKLSRSAGKTGPCWGSPRVLGFRCSGLASLWAPPGQTRPASSAVLLVPSTELDTQRVHINHLFWCNQKIPSWEHWLSARNTLSTSYILVPMTLYNKPMKSVFLPSFYRGGNWSSERGNLPKGTHPVRGRASPSKVPRDSQTMAWSDNC